MNEIFTTNADAILEILTQLMLFVLSAFLTWASTKLPAKWQKEAENAALAAEQKLRESLHSAAVSGVEAGQKMGFFGPELIGFALKHILKSVPDAVIGLTPTPRELLERTPVGEALNKLPPGARDAIENIVMSKINQSMNRPQPKPARSDDDGWRAPHVPSGPST